MIGLRVMGYGGALLAAAFVITGGSGARAEQAGGRQFVRLAAGEQLAAPGAAVQASEPSLVLISLSSEFSTVAVIDGAVSQAGKRARGGDALVSPLDGTKTEVLQFDARRLAATLPPQWATEAAAPLEAIAARQKRQRFWGLLAPARVNASAPAVPALEAVRASYLGNDTIAALRRAANGNPQALSALTAQRFAQALHARDAATVADLIDPKPFTDTGTAAAEWQRARLAFAGRLAGDAALSGAMAAAPVAVPGDQTAFDAGGYRIRLVPRDRALFVTAVEAL
ncbi:MAG: hypothetical protein QM676_10530 [Novosphingobium sp.]